jgi:hypothetical protein|tara:strand:+ start:35422 stop:36003 length:582 start_codon:yes stop_codon:yes gene_type:complete
MKYFVVILILTLFCYGYAYNQYNGLGTSTVSESNDANAWINGVNAEYQRKQNREILESEDLIFRQYLKPNETKVIKAAAERNGAWTYENRYILAAIRIAENGLKGNEFGIKCPKHINTDLDGQAACASVTIMKNRERYEESYKHVDFITFLARRYCPFESDPIGHENWIKNVRYWSNKLHGEYEEHRRLGTLP